MDVCGRLRSHGSFGRNHRHRDREKDTHDHPEKENSFLTLGGDRRLCDLQEPLGDTLMSKFDTDGLLQHPQATILGKRGEIWPKKVTNGSCSANGSSIAGVKEHIFERDFPSSGTDAKTVASEIGISALQKFPIGTSIGGKKWMSPLAEVPALAESNRCATSSQLHNSSPRTKSTYLGLNMVEAVVLGPSRGQTPPQVSVGSQRLGELAIKQSKQLIPVTPSSPKTLVLNSSDKRGNNSTQNLFPKSGGGPVKSYVSKTTNSGKFHVPITCVRHKTDGAIELANGRRRRSSSSPRIMISQFSSFNVQRFHV